MASLIQCTNPILPDYFRLHGKWRASKPALITHDGELSWREFTARLYQIANGLQASGLSVGDRAAVFMSNGQAMAEVLFGLMMGGVCSAPLNTSVSDEAIINMIIDSQAKAIFVTRDHAARINAILDRFPAGQIKLLICAEGEASGWTGYDNWRKAQSADAPELDISEETELNIIYSSGTTGQPKGIVHTHQGRRDYAYDMANCLRYNSSARFMATIGLYSNITWVGMLSALISGGTLLVPGKFDAEQIWRWIEEYRVTHLSQVPLLYQRMMEYDGHETFNASSMQGMMSAGSPLRPYIKQALFDRFVCGVIELYGLTEGVITTLDPEDAPGRMASVGLPILGTDIMILDDADQVCPAGQSGEIISQSRFVMPGYLNRPDATRESLYIDDKGDHWLRTGDIGYLDEDGFLYIVDRKKDMILSGGQNIYPQDIEAVLVGYKDVADAAVIGVKSTKWGETPLAVIAPKNGALDKADLKDWANGQLGRQQRIAGVELIDEIPRNPNGKILKRELRETYKDVSFD